MSDFIKAAPNSWHHKLILSAIPKDSTPFAENFSVTTEKKVNYWDQIYSLTAPLEVGVVAYRAEGKIIAVISVSGSVTVPCSRCLEPAGVAIMGELRYLFSLDKKDENKAESACEADGDEELIILDSWEDEIDLGTLVWEVMITLLPTAHLCSEGCRGLCPKCGANLNSSSCTCTDDDGDPRFEVLRSLVQKEKENN